MIGTDERFSTVAYPQLAPEEELVPPGGLKLFAGFVGSVSSVLLFSPGVESRYLPPLLQTLPFGVTTMAEYGQLAEATLKHEGAFAVLSPLRCYKRRVYNLRNSDVAISAKCMGNSGIYRGDVLEYIDPIGNMLPLLEVCRTC